ncbi:hypothetical protein V2I71_12565 [Peribacillus frigoritolerans]|uniref:hypothetical protein n=1 Tax=Peribacillus TaxID=2675229 RepID=UPI0011409502|nr:hypothetical protein [Peribacillus simplex]WVN13361.1 hypothetical protein V2I71_12565 [Peribacillus frigoritolerans]
MSIFDKILGSIFKTQSNYRSEEGEETCYCDNCRSKVGESDYFANGFLCDDCYDDKYKDGTPSWFEENEDFGQDADHNGICDHCGKSRKYGNCTCR